MPEDLRPTPEDFRPAPSAAPLPSRRGARVAIGVVAVLVVLGISLAFAPVRSFAAQVLSVFRVQKIATISITAEDLERIAKGLEAGDPHVSLDELGDVSFDGNPNFSEEPTFTTLSAAQAEVDFPIRTPAGVEGTQTVLVQPGASVEFTLHVDKVNELLRYYGAEKLLPASLEGKPFTIKVPPTVIVAYGKDKLGFEPDYESSISDEEPSNVTPDSASQDVFIVQTRGPEIVVPQGVDPLDIREVLINLPFLPEDLRRQLSGVSDWQNTLLVPDMYGSKEEITIAGNPAVVIGEPMDGEVPPDADLPPEEQYDYQPPIFVMWQQDGALRAVMTKDRSRSIAVAESMAR